MLNDGYKCFYIGTKNHPEAEGVLGLSNKIKLIDNLNKLPETKSDKIYITNQTTLSLLDLKDFYLKWKNKYPNSIIDNKICLATYERQNALLNQNVDLCIVVGDYSSSNSKKLVEVSEKYGKTKAILIESLKDLDLNILKNKKVVSVTSGASTPEFITDEVIKFLEEYDA
jgi:4-hydroxy-3-methylbut-2-enyl diphosphate reductase